MPVALRRLVVALAGGLLASGGLALTATPAVSAPTAGACAEGAGVTVVVDFAGLGGGVQTRCAPAPVKSGFDALTRAGFAITSVSGQAFLCRIDDKPADESCTRIPSAARYWSYWHAARGEDWTYSSSGASRKPPPGSVEGWAFGGGNEPGAAPPGPITTTTSRPVAPPSTSPPPTAPGGIVPPPGPSPTVDPSNPVTTPSTPPSATTTAPSPGGADAEGGDDAASDITSTAAAVAAAGDTDAGSPVGVLVAAALIAGLGVVGLRTARRRSREAEASG